MKYRREIDGLRAIAVLPVILFHAGFSWFSGGYVGVDVFFVISGYLITTIIVSELSNSGFSIARFYERRARRILPALFFLMLFCIPFALLWLTPSQLQNFSKALIAISFFSSNILFWKDSDYFSPEAEENPLLHTWSLAVEEQFYIVFPLLLFFLWRYKKEFVLPAVAILSISSFFLAEWGWRNYAVANFYLLPTRAWELGVGAICALLLQEKSMRGNSFFASAGLALIIFSVFQYDKNTPFPSVYALSPVVGTALIIFYGTSASLIGRILSARLLVGVGMISYSAYLWHQPLFAFARIRSATPPSLETMVVLSIVSIISGYISWRYVEQPFRKKTNILLNSRAKIFKASAAVISIFTVVGLFGVVSGGLPQRFLGDQIQGSYLESAKFSPFRSKCFSHEKNIIKPSDACRYHTDDGSVAVIGDSHSVELSYAIANSLKKYNMGVRQYSFSACKPSYANKQESVCARWTDDSVDYISNNPDIRYVVISYRMTTAFAEDHYGIYPSYPKEKSEIEKREVIESMDRMLNKFLSANKKVIFVHQAPELPKGMDSIIVNGEISNIEIQGVPRRWWDERTRTLRSSFDLPGNVIVFDPADVFCNDVVCLAGENGESLYFDDNHMSLVGAQKVADILIDSILKK